LKFIAFVIANYNYEENVAESKEFIDWFECNKDWVEIGVHGYIHNSPPEQELDNAEELVEKSLDILNPFLGKDFLYRPPGFQRTIRTEPMLKKMGFGGIAYQTRIKYFNGKIIERNIINCHCCDKYYNPVTKWRNWLK
jgi:predicted deacetylase